MVIRLRVSKASPFYLSDFATGALCLDKQSLFSVTQTGKQTFATKEAFL